MKFQLEGVIPAMLTPFAKRGTQVDYEKACALAVRLAGQGVHGLFPCGTTGEGMLMTLDERKRLIAEVVKAVRGRVKVIAHTGCLDTASTIELTCEAFAAGADAAGVVAPGFYGYDDESLLQHFGAIAKAAPGKPILMYNIPGCAKNVLTPKLIVELANRYENIVGMKDSSGNMSALTQTLAHAPQGFHVINGVDEYSFQALVAGAKGCVSSTANVVPELFLAIFNAVKAGDHKKAWKAQIKLSDACGLFHYGSYVAYYKEGLRLRGFDAGAVRPPQRELNAAERSRFAKSLKEAGLI